MASLINNSAAGMQVSANTDGTISGGFVSITGGRYRMVLNGPNGGASYADANEKRCNHQACENRVDCTGSTNDFDCTNSGTCLASAVGNTSFSLATANTFIAQ